MEEYIKINVKDYVGKLLNKNSDTIDAVKKARVIARKGKVNEKIISWSQDSEGNEIVEKVAIVDNDSSYILTKADSEGNPIVDKNGHTNEWVVSSEVFEKKYEVDYNDVFKPKGGIQKFIRIQDNIILEQWGSEMKIAVGGYINITDENDMYGISERDFNDTYKTLEEKLLRRSYEKR